MDTNKWLAIVGLISALALGIGLVTSLVSVGLGWIINNEQKVEIAASNKEAKDAGERAANALRDAGVANEAAGKANERAGLADAEAARANEGLAQSNVEIARLTVEAERAKAERAEADKQIAIAQAAAALARQSTEELRERNLETARQLEEEKLRVAELRAAVAPRSLNPSVSAETMNALKPYAHTSVLIIVFNDFEAARLAKQIERLLLRAGWGVGPPHVISTGQIFDPRLTWNREGIMIEAVETVNWSPDEPAKALQNALTLNGLEEVRVSIIELTDVAPPSRTIRIWVGAKPRNLWQ